LIIDDYNVNIHNIRESECSNLALTHKTAIQKNVRDYDQLIEQIKGIDKKFHGLNPIAIQILNLPEGAVFTYTAKMKQETDSRIPDLITTRTELTSHAREVLRELE
jgi:uncharacterized protein YeeX (DUF496 family)